MRETQIPPAVSVAIRVATKDATTYSVACRLFEEDASDSRPAHLASQGHLERALARTTLDAWRHGLGSVESVGLSYAVAGELVAYAPHAAWRARIAESRDEDAEGVHPESEAIA
jgi:hypothetical protein